MIDFKNRIIRYLKESNDKNLLNHLKKYYNEEISFDTLLNPFIDCLINNNKFDTEFVPTDLKNKIKYTVHTDIKYEDCLIQGKRFIFPVGLTSINELPFYCFFIKKERSNNYLLTFLYFTGTDFNICTPKGSLIDLKIKVPYMDERIVNNFVINTFQESNQEYLERFESELNEFIEFSKEFSTAEDLIDLKAKDLKEHFTNLIKNIKQI